MPSDFGNPGRSSGTDLVAELHKQHDQQIVDQQRQQRSRRRRTVVEIIVTIIVLAALGVAAKLAYDRHRLTNAVQTAKEHLAEGSASEVAVAVADLERALDLDPNNRESQGLMALARAQQAVVTGDGAPLDKALDAAGDADEPEVVLARAVKAALDGDLEAVQTVLDDVDPPTEPASLVRTHAWLHGRVALGHALDRDEVDGAIAELDAVSKEAVWVPGSRLLAALLLRAGRLDDALDRVAAARQADPTNIGLAADEALIHAVYAKHQGGVVEVAGSLLSNETLTARDRGRLYLARGIVRARKGDTDDAGEDLDEAWSDVPEWDLDSRALVVEAAIIGGQADRARRWLGDLDLDKPTHDAFEAWLTLNDGKIAESLEICAKLPQTHPRVALVQALALTEQLRFKEAVPWIDRAMEAFGPRLRLRVAKWRAQAHVGNAKEAVEKLEEIADEHKETPRVYTALGEAQLELAGDDGSTKDAEKSLRKAIEREDKPAEAAYLLGELLKKQAADEPKLVPDAVEMLQKAADIDEDNLRYRVALGLYLADYGTLDRAEKVLSKLSDKDDAPASVLLALTDVELLRADMGHVELDPKEAAGWLAEATKRGAPAVQVTLLQARLANLSGDKDELDEAANALYAILAADPKQGAARVLYGETLLHQGNIPAARTTLRDGEEYSEDRYVGELMIGRAAVELADGGDRQAASIAYKGWQKIAQVEMPANERLALARRTAKYWDDIENYTVPRSISKAVVDSMPWRADAWAFRALTQIADDKRDEACESADQALKLDPDLGEAHYAMAECYIARRRYPDARDELSAAIKQALSGAEKRKYKRRLRVVR